MNAFPVSTYFQGLSPQASLMARFELANFLTLQGQRGLAREICNTAMPWELARHLVAVDRTIRVDDPEALFRSSRLFSASGKLIHGPMGRGPRPLEERAEKLSSLAGAVRSQNPAGSKIEGYILANAIERFLNGDEVVEGDRARMEAYILEGKGYLSGLAGGQLDDKVLAGLLERVEDAADASVYGARLFVDAIKSGNIFTEGRIAARHVWLSHAFVEGAMNVWDRRVSKGKMPPFVESASHYWVRAHVAPYSDAVRDYSREIGRGFGRFMLSRMEMAFAAGLPGSRLNKALYLFDVETFIYGRGWLKGNADRRVDSDAWVGTLRKNLHTVVHQSMSRRDVGYMAEAVPNLPDMLSSIDDGVARLSEEGKSEVAEAIIANRGTIIHRALYSGGMNGYVGRALGAMPGMLSSIDDEVARLSEEGKSEAVEAILANRGNIISRALYGRGLVGYVSKALDAVPGMLSAIRDEVKNLKREGKSEAAEAILANRGTIISRSLNSGGMNGYVGRALRAVPGMLSAIDDEVTRLEVADESDALEAILANRRTIINRALSTGGLERYVSNAFKAVLL